MDDFLKEKKTKEKLKKNLELGETTIKGHTTDEGEHADTQNCARPHPPAARHSADTSPAPLSVVHLLLRGLRVLLHVLVDATAHGGLTVAAVHARAHTDNARVHGARDAVLDLRVDLRETVVLHDRRVAEIAERRRLDDVAHNKALHGLVLGDTAAAVAAAHDGGVATVLLRAASVATLESHPDTNSNKNTQKQK